SGLGARTGEGHMRDSAGRGGGFDMVVLLETLQSIPEPDASAEHDGDQHDVHVVDEPGSKELAYHGGAPADAYILATCGLAGRLERLGWGGVEGGGRRAPPPLDGRGGVVGQDEDGCVERRVGAPRALPVRVLVPPGEAPLPSTHDLGADPPIVPLQECVVDATGAAGLADLLVPPASS